MHVDEDFEYEDNAYGEIYFSGKDQNIAIDAASTWYQVAAISLWSEGTAKNISLSSNDFDVERNGIYVVVVSITMYSAENGVNLALRINYNDSEYSVGEAHYTVSSNIISITETGIFSIYATNDLSIEIMNATNDDDISVISSQVSIHKVDRYEP